MTPVGRGYFGTYWGIWAKAPGTEGIKIGPEYILEAGEWFKARRDTKPRGRLSPCKVKSGGVTGFG